MNYKILFLLPLMAAGLASCHDELEETVYSNLTDQTAFTSAENAQAAVNAMYAPLHSIYRDPMFEINDGTTDVCIASSTSAIETLNDNAIAVEWCDLAPWEGFFQVTSRANIVLDQVGAMDDALFGDDYDKAQMLAEAHFMRGYGYLQLSDVYYRVPLVLSSDVEPDSKLPLATIDEIETAIEDDLKAALTLPETYATHADGNRPTLGAVRGFLVRLYMRQAGRIRQAGGNDAPYWQKALEVVNQIMGMEGTVYNLQPTEWDVFDPYTEASRYNDELMFAIRATEAISSGSWDLGLMWTNWSYDMGWQIFVVPLSQYWFFDTDDQRRSEMMVTEFPNVYNDYNAPETTTYYEAPENMSQVALKNRSNLDAAGQLKPGEEYGQVEELGYVFTRKYEYHNTFKYTYRTENNAPVMRFADMILCKAEILNELNGPNQESINLMNRIRERAFQDSNHNLKLADYTTKEALRSELCDERARELYMEGVRRPDLIRMGLWKDRMEKYFNSIKAIARQRELNENQPQGFYDNDWKVYPQDLTENDIRRYMPVPQRETIYNPDLANNRE